MSNSTCIVFSVAKFLRNKKAPKQQIKRRLLLSTESRAVVFLRTIYKFQLSSTVCISVSQNSSNSVLSLPQTRVSCPTATIFRNFAF